MTSIENDRARYRIRVQGRLGAEWVARRQGMKVVIHDGAGLHTVSVLTGLMDQAELMGILQELYNRGATLLSVGRLESRSADESASGPPSPATAENSRT